jgi:tetratricopeptide (TPR) repeat protein
MQESTESPAILILKQGSIMCFFPHICCANILRMKRHLLLSILTLALFLTVAQAGEQPSGDFNIEVGQDRESMQERHRGENLLFGDFNIEGIEAKGQSHTFYVVLYTRTGQFVSRQAVTPGGRYRFHSIANGEYLIAVEADGTEVTRISILIQELRRTDVRQDISLKWRDEFTAKKSPAAGTISAEEAYNRTPENQQRYEKAATALEKKDQDQAVSLFREVVNSDPKDYISLTQLGSALFLKKQYDEAGQAYKSALELKPSFLPALMNMGKLQMAQKNMDGAVETFTRAVTQHPKSAAANFFLGEAYLQIKKGSKAVGYLYEAIRLDPVGHAEAHLRLATLYNAAGLKDKAVVEYEQFLAKVPDHPSRKTLEKYIKENKK